MKIVGLLDSPFVRRSVITARMLGIPFEHQSLSVFRNFDEFHAINPLTKAPTLAGPSHSNDMHFLKNFRKVVHFQ